MHNLPNHIKSQILVDALPYIQKYNNKIIVIKYGGNAMSDENLKHIVMGDIVLLALIGIKVILVHGGGPDIDDLLNKIGKKSEFIDGLRKTDKQTMEIVNMVLSGKVNKDLVRLLAKHKGNAIGLCGMDANILQAKQLKPELGQVGEITEVNTKPILDLLEKGYIPIIASVAMGEDGSMYNINADIAASKIAASLQAQNLILMTDVVGVLRDKNDKSTIIPSIKIDQIDQLKKDGIISGGMIPKTQCCFDALLGGVKKTCIIDGTIPHSILIELLSNEGIGTEFIKGEDDEIQ